MTDSTPQTVEEHADAIVAAAGDLLRHQAINKVADHLSKRDKSLGMEHYTYTMGFRDESIREQCSILAVALGGTPETIYREIIAAQSRCHRLEGSVAA